MKTIIQYVSGPETWREMPDMLERAPRYKAAEAINSPSLGWEVI